MTMIEVEPQPRIDTIVQQPDGSQMWRSDYAGVVWLDGKPEVAGPVLRRSANAPRGMRTTSVDVSFFLPDCLPYVRSELGDARLSLSVSLRGAGDTGAITSVAATFAEDPAGLPVWIQVFIRGHLGWPAGISYQMVALTTPAAVLQR